RICHLAQMQRLPYLLFFFLTAPCSVIYILSLHDALPICVEFDNGDMYVDGHKAASDVRDEFVSVTEKLMDTNSSRTSEAALWPRSEERFSRNAETDIVCRLLLEKKKKTTTIEYPAMQTRL